MSTVEIVVCVMLVAVLFVVIECSPDPLRRDIRRREREQRRAASKGTEQ